MALTRLAALVKADNDPGLLLAYADNLQDVSPRGLELAFADLEGSWTVPGTLPMPAEIKALAGRLLDGERRSKEHAEQQREQRELRAARERGETFGLADVMKAIRSEQPAQMPTVDVAVRRRELKDQAEQLLRKEAE